MTSATPDSAAPNTSERLSMLDALRGLMALAVAVYHFAVWTHVFPAGSRLSSNVIVLGIHSVEGFFIISGFCFFYLYQGRPFTLDDARAFHIKRFFRIAPLYYLALALTLALGQSPGPLSTRVILENLTLSFGLFHPNHSRVLGGWSIGVEYVFYLAFPLLLWLARARFGPLLMLLGFGLLALPYNYVRVPQAPELARFNAYVLVPNQAVLFALGGAMAALRTQLRLRLTGLQVLAGTVLIAGLFQLWLTPFYDHFSVMMGTPRLVCIAASGAIVLLCGLAHGAAGRALKPLVVLGDLSYAVYLLHPFGWYIVSRVGGLRAQPRLSFALGLVTTLALAGLVHWLLERPLLRLGRRYAERRRHAQRPAPPRARTEGVIPPEWPAAGALAPQNDRPPHGFR